VIFDDEWHSGQEHREITIGQSEAGRLLAVSFVERESVSVLITSVRPVTNREREHHEENVIN
jgi:uncharacterized protein